MRSRKRPCRPKTAKRIFGGPGSQSPSGQAKERTRILPVRRGSFCPACRAIWQAGRSCAASRCYAGFCARCPGVCSLLQPWRPCVRLAAIVSAFCGVVFRPTRRLPLLRSACAAPRGLLVVCPLCAEGTGFFAAFSCAAHGKLFLFLPVFRCFVPGLRAAFLPPLRRHFCACLSGLRCLPAVRFVRAVPSCFGCLFACSVLVARAFFSYLLSFAFSCLALTSQTSFPLSLRPRRASTFFRKESRQRFARGRGSAPFEPPFLCPAADLPFPRAAGRLKRPFRPQTAGR